MTEEEKTLPEVEPNPALEVKPVVEDQPAPAPEAEPLLEIQPAPAPEAEPVVESQITPLLEQKPAPETLKINIAIQGDRVFLGAQSGDCDPKMTTLQGTLQTALERIPVFVEESQKQWAINPHNPKSTIPEPVPATPAASRSTSTRVEKPVQPKFF